MRRTKSQYFCVCCIVLTAMLLTACFHDNPNSINDSAKSDNMNLNYMNNMDNINRAAEIKAKEQKKVPSTQSLLESYGYLDITTFGADPTGKTDSTKQIQAAIDAAYAKSMVVFFPTGTYLVSDTLNMRRIKDPDQFRTRKGHVLVGSTKRKRPLIQLADSAPGFDDPSREDTSPTSPTTTKPVIHFWTNKTADDKNAENELGAIDYNQVFRGIDIDLGSHNPGAVGIRHRGQEGTSTQDVRIDATGGFAGIYSTLGSGGSITNVEIVGGKYGVYSRKSGSMPVLTGFKMSGQTDVAIYYAGLTPMTVVGFEIDKSSGPVFRIDKYSTAEESWGNLTLVDGKISLTDGDGTDTLIDNTDRMIYMENVYVKNVGKLSANSVDGTFAEVSNPAVWSKVEEYAYSKVFEGDKSKLIDMMKTNETQLSVSEYGGEPPTDLISRHVWEQNYWTFEAEGVVVVTDPEFGAVGDGKADDTQAIQKAIDAAAEAGTNRVFIPKGHYRISGTIKLREHTKLFGIARYLTVLEPTGWKEDVNTPIIESADSKDSTNVLANMKLEIYRTANHIYFVNWRAGRNSIVNSVWNCMDFDGSQSKTLQQWVRITGNGGGRWYNHTTEIGYNSNVEGYRGVLVEGTTEPLFFYMFHNQHIKSDAISEVKNASNVTFYGVKTETQTEGSEHDINKPDAPWPISLKISGSDNINIYGYSGMGQAKEGRGLFEIFDSTNVTVANMARWSSNQYPLDSWYYIKIAEGELMKGVHANTPVNLVKIGEDWSQVKAD